MALSAKRVNAGQITRRGKAFLHAFADDGGEPPPAGMAASQLPNAKAWPRVLTKCRPIPTQESALSKQYLSLRPLSVASSAYIFAISTCVEVFDFTCLRGHHPLGTNRRTI